MNRELRTFIYVLSLLLLVFFLYKTANLSSHRHYKGKVIDVEYRIFEEGNKWGGTSKIFYKIPVIEFYNSKEEDTIIFTDTRYIKFENFNKGDIVNVLDYEIKGYGDKPRIYTFLYYWLNANELMYLLLVSVVINYFILSYYYKYKHLKQKILK